MRPVLRDPERKLEGRAAERASRIPMRTPTPELARLLHEEIDRLPERYRVPIVLCDLEGRTCEEAARVMGRPVGTIKCSRPAAAIDYETA